MTLREYIETCVENGDTLRYDGKVYRNFSKKDGKTYEELKPYLDKEYKQ